MSIEKDIKTINCIPSNIKHWADTAPDKEVFVFYNENGRTNVLTARDVYTLAGRFATRLRNMGFQQGDVISNAVPNSAERVVTDFGIIMAGCIGSNCQIMEKDGSDFWKTANCLKTKGVILPNHINNSSYRVMHNFIKTKLPVSECVDVSLTEVPSLKRILFVNGSGENCSRTQLSFLDSLLQSSEAIFYNQEEISADSTACIFATSGTTGYSKLIPRSHDTILTIAYSYEIKIPSVRFCQRPLGWIGGFPFGYFANATCNVIQDCFKGEVALTEKMAWERIEKELCTVSFMLLPEMESFLMYFKNNPPKYRLKALVIGGQPITKKACDAIGVLTDILILTYGSTEMMGVANHFLTSPGQMEDFIVGKPMPGVSLKIVDENFQEVAPGEGGRVVVKSPFVSKSYYNHSPDKMTHTKDGYFISGDRGWVTEDGVLFVSDRYDEVIHHGSILVYPSWPESVLAKIPGISEVVVFGVPGPESQGVNDSACACVVLEPESAITKESIISSYTESFVVTGDEYFPKLTYVELFSEFPTGYTGKTRRGKLREMAMDRIRS